MVPEGSEGHIRTRKLVPEGSTRFPGDSKVSGGPLGFLESSKIF